MVRSTVSQITSPQDTSCAPCQVFTKGSKTISWWFAHTFFVRSKISKIPLLRSRDHLSNQICILLLRETWSLPCLFWHSHIPKNISVEAHCHFCPVKFCFPIFFLHVYNKPLEFPIKWGLWCWVGFRQRWTGSLLELLFIWEWSWAGCEGY